MDLKVYAFMCGWLTEIADVAVYLASDQVRGVTGQALDVCAGTVLY